MSLVAHLSGQLRKLCRGLADEASFPNIVSERLLAIDMLAMDQREVGGERVRVLRRGDHDGVEVVRPIEHAPQVRELFGLRVSLRRGVQRELVHIAEHRDVLVGMRPVSGRAGSPAAPACTTAWHDGEFAQARVRATASGNERDVQFTVEILAAQKRRRRGEDTGRQGPANKLTPRHRAGERFIRSLLHGLWEIIKIQRIESS